MCPDHIHMLVEIPPKYSVYEACDGNPGMASLFPIARVLGISLDGLC